MNRAIMSSNVNEPTLNFDQNQTLLMLKDQYIIIKRNIERRKNTALIFYIR